MKRNPPFPRYFNRPEPPEFSPSEAIDHIAKCTAMIALVTNQPEYAIKVKVLGLKLSVCDNEAFIKMLESEMAEANKALLRDKNKFE